jgi:SAM-dependent methyltransferase
LAADEFDDGYFGRLDRAVPPAWTRGGVVDATDISAVALRRTRDAGLTRSLTRSSVAALPYRDGTFDLVVSADVVQHLPVADVPGAWREMARVLRPGGRLLVRTNTQCARDTAAETATWRLSDPAAVEAEVRDAGLDLVRITHANVVSALAARARRLVRRPGPTGIGGHAPGAHEHHDGHEHHRHAEHGTSRSSRSTDRVLGATLALEARWLRNPRRRLPVGHTLFVVATKPAR